MKRGNRIFGVYARSQITNLYTTVHETHPWGAFHEHYTNWLNRILRFSFTIIFTICSEPFHKTCRRNAHLSNVYDFIKSRKPVNNSCSGSSFSRDAVSRRQFSVPNKMSDKRKKGRNWSREETHCLVTFGVENHSSLSGSFTNSLTNADKDELWKRITEM